MKLTRLVSILVCLVLALSLAACGQTPTPTTVPTEPPETTVPTEPPLDPVAFYADAVAALEAGNYQLNVERTKDVDVAGEAFTQTWKQTLTRLGDLTNANNIIDYGSYKISADEIWTDGTAYLDIEDTLFSTSMDAETFAARYAPLSLFTAENYGSVTAQEGDSVVITFAEATAAESWLAPEAATLVSAEGSATLTAEGKLTEASYNLTYSYGGVTITGGNLALTSGVASVVFGDTGVTVAGGAELPAGVVVEQDEYDDFFLSMEEGETLFIRTPFSAELKQDGIHLTNSPWDLAVMIISYDADGRIIDIQMEVTPDGVVTPAVTGNTVTAFFVNSRSIPLDSALPIP